MTDDRQREETIFDAALELPDEKRGAFLLRECAGDDALRQRVETLLLAGQTKGVLDASPAAVLREQLSSSSPVSEKPGDRIGRYRLLQQIGEGGCGVVYMAEQEEPVRRRVALKVIKLGMDTRRVIARFEAERQALALMDHPNITSVWDAGATAAGRPFFVMELVRGVKLTEYCDQNHLSTDERLQLFTQVCHALQHAHQKGIIHRDIKPSNILVTMHDGVPVPKVIDFGIAKATSEQRLTDKTMFTAFEQFVGTPAYMSPEQAELSALDVDTRSDIYSLGVLLYELLTGTTPFDAKELTRSGFDAMRRTIREVEPVKPSKRLMQAAKSQIPKTKSETGNRQSAIPSDLDWIVMKCLEKDRARRYETANGLAMDIERFQKHEPVVACPPGNFYRFQKLVRRNRLTFAAIAIGGLVVTGGVIGIFSQWRRAEEHARGEGEQRRMAEDYAARVKLNLYAGDINFASQALKQGDLGLARRTLDALRPRDGEQDLRGFEWRHLWSQCQGDQIATLTGHEWIVTCAAFSPDGNWLATGGFDRTVKIWNATNQELVTTLNAATGAVWSVAFTPDSTRLVTSGRGGTKLWNCATWHVERMFPGLASSMAKHSPLLATTEAIMFYWWESPGIVSVWNYETGDLVRTFPKPSRAIAISPDGKTLATSERPRGINLWDVETGQLTRTLATSNAAWAIRFAPDGDRLLAVAGTEFVALWELRSNTPPQKIEAHALGVWAAEFSPDGETIATSSSDQTTRLLDARTLNTKDILRGHTHEVWCAAFSPNGNVLATGSKDSKVLLWSSGVLNRLPVLPGRHLRHPVFSPDGRFILTEPGVASGVLWELDGFRREREFPRRFALGFTPDGSQVVFWNGDFKSLDRVSVHSGEVVSNVRLENEEEFSKTMQIQGLTPDGKLFHVTYGESRVVIWDASTGKILHRLQGPRGPLEAGVISPDGKNFAMSARLEQSVHLYDCRSGAERLLNGHKDGVRGLAFSPDGTMLASGSLDGSIRLWDVAGGECIATLPGHMEETSAVAFSPDGRTLASVNERLSVKLWHVATRRELASWHTPHASGWLKFSPDGKHLALLTRTNSIQLFAAPE